MDILQNAFTEALARNTEENDRWTRYLEDHRKASENLEQFRKSIDVEIMVPIGSKAMMPGRLYHTNEIFLSHSSQMYSKCSAHQALGVCSHRMTVAQQRLDDLEKERELYQNKLELPLNEDAFQSSGEQEIIEEYNEEEELQWREKHRASIRRLKEKEREARNAESSDIDVNAVLDELELMEELDYELESMNIDSDDKLEKIMSGKLVVPSDKKRISHADAGKAMTPMLECVPAPKSSSTNEIIAPKSHISNFQPLESSSGESEDDDDDEDTDEDVPDEFRAYRFETEGMPVAEKIKFYREKLHTIQTYLKTSNINTFEEFVRKTDRMFLCDHLQSEIDRLQDDGEPNGNEEVTTKKTSTSKNHRRSVSFGKEQIASFSKHQAPSRVSQDLKKEQDDGDELSSEQLTEKERLKKYVEQVAALNVEEVTKAMNEHHLNQVKTKSILKNKAAVDQERRTDEADVSNKNVVPDEKERAAALVEFDKIMGDIFEKTVVAPLAAASTSNQQTPDVQNNRPDALPSGEFRDAHAPKARVSRFKASREKAN